MFPPSNGLIIVRKFCENLLPGDGDKNTCMKKEYVGVTKEECNNDYGDN